MLSIEPDPPLPCQISLLKSGSSDEKASSSSSDKLVENLDLSNSGLDDNNNNNPLPKFSLREYVFRTRRKDIKTNWPFSQKNLQLCVKHGVTDFLPPFQSVDKVKKSTVKGRVVDNCEREHVIPDDDPAVITSSSSARCISKLAAADYVDINSSGSDREKVFRSTTTSKSCSEINSVPIRKRKPCLEVEAVTLLEPLVAKPESKGLCPPISNKSGSTIQPPAKKCRLIVKLGNTTNPTLEEDTSTNNFMSSEAMASKVCPVCKTFSSSSNTTLNAHIDQCLSGESTIKWTTNSKVSKHRIKPRKTRLMVDIYATAVRSTLEDLDRRNGTNWASNPSFPVQEIEVSADEKPEKQPPVSLECTGNEGEVYIDANGTKLRILSKLNEEQPPLSKLVNDPIQKKLVKGDKGRKFLLTKTRKKKNHVEKYRKLLKSASQSKKYCLPKPSHCPEINSGQESNSSPKENVDKEDCPSKHVKSPDKYVVFGGSGTIKQWACSKRTGLTRKINVHQLSGSDVLTGLQNDNVLLPPSHSLMKGSCLLKAPSSSAKTVCLPESSKGVEHMQVVPHDDHSEETSLPKKGDFSSCGSQFPRDKKKSFVLQKRKEKYLKVDGPSVNGCVGDTPKHRVNHAPSANNTRVVANTGLLKDADKSDVNCKLSTSHSLISSNAKKFSSLGKNFLSVSEGVAPGVKCNLKWKTVAHKKSRVHCTSESEEDVVWQTEEEKHCSRRNVSEAKVQGSKSCDRITVNRSMVLKVRKKRGGVVVSNTKGILGLTSSQSSDGTHSDNEVGRTLAGESDDMRPAKKHLQSQKDKRMELATSELVAAGDFTSFSKSLDAGSDELSGPSRSHCDSKLLSDEYKGSFVGTEATTCSEDPILGVDHGMFSATEIGRSMIDQNVHVAVELGSNDGQGNYFLEVDPIPIPGPPGSFLPSPGHMSSEDLHGNSSLTSSVDHPEFIDQNSSGSPISATSPVSNFTVAKFGSRYSGKLSLGGRDSSERLGCQTVQEDIRSSFSGSNIDLSEKSTTLLQTANIGEDSRDVLEEFNVNKFFPGKGPFRFTNDHKPCCCVRKEGSSQGFALSREESQLLLRRSMTSGNEKQLSSDSNRTSDNVILKTNTFSLSDSSSGPETSATKSSMGHAQFGISADSKFKLPTLDSGSVSPSASNPVLRLMGKNLMIVNKDEDISPEQKESHLNSMDDLANTKLPGVSYDSLRNEDPHSFCQVDAHDRLISHLPQSGDLVQHYDVRLSNGFKSQQPPPIFPVSFSSRSGGSGLMGSSGRHENIGGCNLHAMQDGPSNGLCSPRAYDMMKSRTAPASRWQNETSAVNVVKEIIVIDDSPESEANSSTDAAYTTGMPSKLSSAGIQMQMTQGYNSRFINVRAGLPRGSPYNGSGITQNADLPTPHAKGVIAIPAKWNCNPEGSSVVHPTSFSASSSPAGPYNRSPFYYSPGFS